MIRSMRLLASFFAVLILAVSPVARAQFGTAFTYQGNPEEIGLPATGNYNMQFTPGTPTWRAHSRV